MKILVTGGAGFIGSHFCERLVKEGIGVVCVDDLNDYYNPEFKKKNLAWLKKQKRFCFKDIDICNQRRLRGVFKAHKIDKIVHLAARAGVRASIENPKIYEEVNVGGTLNLLKLSVENKVGQFILGSSSSVYGNSKKIPFEETDSCDSPISPYAATKRAAELLTFSFRCLYQVPVTVLRFFTVYGPRGRPDMVPYLFTKAIFKGRQVVQFGDGSSSRDYTFVDDIVEGILKATKNKFDFEIINLGGSKSIKLKVFIKLLEEAVGRRVKIRRQKEQPGDVRQTWANIKKAGKLLGWKPRVTLKDGLELFVDWFKKERLKKVSS